MEGPRMASRKGNQPNLTVRNESGHKSWLGLAHLAHLGSVEHIVSLDLALEQ